MAAVDDLAKRRLDERLKDEADLFDLKRLEEHGQRRLAEERLREGARRAKAPAEIETRKLMCHILGEKDDVMVFRSHVVQSTSLDRRFSAAIERGNWNMNYSCIHSRERICHEACRAAKKRCNI